jgi:hypothetical protein
MEYSSMSEDFNPKSSPRRSSSSSRGPQKKEESSNKNHPLTRLIYIICISIVGFVGINFFACNFMIPGTINSANVLGGLKNPPPLDCKESEKKGYDTLLGILTTIIALKTKMED